MLQATIRTHLSQSTGRGSEWLASRPQGNKGRADTFTTGIEDNAHYHFIIVLIACKNKKFGLR
jgi:hypothetical protein